MATALAPATEPPINTEEQDETIPENSDKSENIPTNSDTKSDSEPKKPDSDTKSDSEDKKSPEDDSATRAFECNICLDTASDAVISMCGHLFCWPCLHQWLETRPQRQICPVCKAGIGRDKVVPLYGRDGDQKDPREKPIPPRPRGQRPEPESAGGANGGQFGNMFNTGGFQMSFGIGAFPFGFFATNFNWGQEGYNQGPAAGSAQFDEEQFLHRVFLWVAFAFIFWLLIA